MNNKSPTHDEVARRAQEIWGTRGRPSGQDEEIWLEAEQQLITEGKAENTPARSETGPKESPDRTSSTGNSSSPEPASAAVPTPSPVPVEHPVPTPSPLENSAKVAQQKKAARAPKTPVKIAPKATPPGTGKPLWDKPHSS